MRHELAFAFVALPRCLRPCSSVLARAFRGARTRRARQPKSGAPSALVYLRDVDPSILQDIRYAGPDNFTGRPVPGYAAAECLLLRDVAEALSRVQAGAAASAICP